MRHIRVVLLKSMILADKLEYYEARELLSKAERSKPAEQIQFYIEGGSAGWRLLGRFKKAAEMFVANPSEWIVETKTK